METVTKDEVMIRKDNFIGEILKGAIFIYPTDTIYGIGCSAKLSEKVKKMREMKGRAEAPFSVIAPSKQWILDNCVVTKEAEEWVNKLPGPFTLVLKLKKKDCIAKEVNNGMGTLGVRIPDHWVKNLVEDIGIPIVTTSVNKTGGTFMTSSENLDESLESQADFMIDEGEKKGKPSTVIHLDKGAAEIRER